MDKNERLVLSGKVVIIAAAFAAAFVHPLPDLACIGLKLGEHIARDHTLAPNISYLPVIAGWWDISWLWHALSYAIFSVGGIIGLKIFAGALAALFAFILLTISTRERKEDATVILSLTLLIILGKSLSFNPMLAGMALFAAQMLLLFRRGGRIYFLLPLYLIWSQVDSGFVAGFVYLTAYTFSEKNAPLKQRIIWPLLALAGALPSPTMWRFIRNPLSMTILFEPSPDFHQILNLLQAVALFSGLGGAALRKERSGRVFGLIAIAALGFVAGEYFPLAACAAAPLIMDGGMSLWAELRLQAPRILSAGLLITLILGIFALSWAWRPGRDEEALISFLKSHPFFGQIFSPLDISGRVAMVTSKKIAVDERTGIYPAETGNIYAKLIHTDSTDWDSLVSEYEIGGIVLPASGFDYSFVSRKPDWALVFENGSFALFVRDKGLNTALLDRWGVLKPHSTEEGPQELASEMKERALEWELKGNPYRALYSWKMLLKVNPLDAQARTSLEANRRKIMEAERKRW